MGPPRGWAGGTSKLILTLKLSNTFQPNLYHQQREVLLLPMHFAPQFVENPHGERGGHILHDLTELSQLNG